jgi:hypothetical protein
MAASWVGSRTIRYRVAAFGADPHARRVLDSIRRITNTEIVSLSVNQARPDLIVIGASDLSDATLTDLSVNSGSSVLIVSHVCQPIDTFLELAPARLRKGRFVQIGGERRLMPELVSLSEMIQERFCECTPRPAFAEAEPRRHKVRVFSDWAVWIDSLA